MVHARCFLVEFKYSSKVAYVVEFSHKKIRLFAKNQIVREDGIELESLDENEAKFLSESGFAEIVIETPYEFKDLWDEEEKCFLLQTIQHSDVLYIFSENYPIMSLKRYSNVDWRLEELEILNGPFEHMNSTENYIKSSGVDGDVELIADEDVFKSSDVGRLLRLRNFDDDETKLWSAGVHFSVGEICLSDNKYYEALNSAESGSVKPVHSVGIKSDGGVRWRYIHDGNGVVKIVEFVDAKRVKAKVVSRLAKSILKGTLYWEFGMLHNGYKHPKSGAFFRNRFCFLLNTETGPYVCMSCSGDYNNFSDMEEGEATDLSAISVPIVSEEFNEGKWIYAKDVLFVGTGSSEFYIDVMTTSQAMSQDNVKVSKISNIGSKGILPIAVGQHVFFVDRFGLSIRDLMFDYYNDGYVDCDISVLGKHLFKSRIVAMRYQEFNDNILWCLTGDGKLVGMTFSADQEVAAFSRHDFSGDVESIAIIPDYDECRDVLWIAVKRMINFRSVRTIEKVEAGMIDFMGESVKVEQSYKKKDELEKEYLRCNAMYLDGAVLFERKVGDDSSYVMGLEHLEGEYVKIFADGMEVKEQVVVDGKVSISSYWARVLVGLAIKSQFIPQSIVVQSERGSSFGQKQRINHVLLMLYRSGGGKIGPNEDELRDIYYRKSDAKLNRVEELFSGCKEILFNGATNVEQMGVEIMIENSSSFPMNILGIMPFIDVNE